MKNKYEFGNDMAIVGTNRLLLCGLLLTLLITTFFIVEYIIDNVEFAAVGFAAYVLISPLFILPTIILILLVCPFDKITFDDSGISVEWQVSGEKRHSLYPVRSATHWKEIEDVDWQKWKGFVFFPVEVRASAFLCLHPLMANRNSALKIAVKKLPEKKFSEAARNKLREMGLS